MLADETGLKLTVCHFPPGTSKWNKIEHRMFCHITGNWRGRPLSSYGVIVKLIANTTTSTGLTIEAELDTRAYSTGIRITDEQMRELNLTKHNFHGSDWTYTLEPRTAPYNARLFISISLDASLVDTDGKQGGPSQNVPMLESRQTVVVM